jgi:2-desacetyl-2-hydroxyethyl bacteriochlorophyllide A dehydrogenase
MRRRVYPDTDEGKLAPMGNGRSLWFVGPRSVEITAEPLPPLEDGQVLIRTSFSGISGGTEMLAYRGELDPDMAVDETIGTLGGTFRFPFRYGYSCVGIVEKSRSELEEGAFVFAFHPHQDAFVMNAGDVVALGSVDPRNATLFPLLETALQITLDAGPRLGETVVVLGLGAVGTLTALLLQRAGARVVAAEPEAWRRDTALDLGVDAVTPDALQLALSSDGRPALVPLVVEVSGNPEALRNALGLLSHEGTVLVASWYGTKHVSLPLGGEFHRRRLTIRSTQVSTIPARLSSRWNADRRRGAVVDLLSELPLGRLATHTFPFDRACDAYAEIDAGSEGLIHAALGYR